MAAFGAANNQSRIFPAKLEIKDPDALRSAIAWHARTDRTLLSQCVRSLRRQHGIYEDLQRKEEPFRRGLPECLVAETLSYLDLAEIGAAARALGGSPALVAAACWGAHRFDQPEELAAACREDIKSWSGAHDPKADKLCLTLSLPMTQTLLREVSASTLGRSVTELEFSPEYDAHLPSIDLDDDAVRFPVLKSIDLTCQGLASIEFSEERTPLLEHLNIDQPCNGPYSGGLLLNFDLPELKHFALDHVTVDSEGCELSRSLSRSPKLESFFGNKVWGLGVGRRKHAHFLVLPSCETLSLYRSDDLDHLILYAPRLKDLNLQACYSIESVRIIDDLDLVPYCLGLPVYGELPVDTPKERMSCDKRVRRIAKALAAGRAPSRYKVNVANTRAGASSIDHEQEELDGNVLTHPRCRKVQREVEDYSRYNWDSDADSAGEPPEPVSADRIRADAEALAPHEERLRELCGDYDALPASDRLMLSRAAGRRAGFSRSLPVVAVVLALVVFPYAAVAARLAVHLTLVAPPPLTKFGPQIIVIVSPIIDRIHTFYDSRGRGAAERLPLERVRRADLFPAGML